MNYRVLPLTKLTEHFARLPGIGKKSAQRLAFHILRMPEEEAKAYISKLIQSIKLTPGSISDISVFEDKVYLKVVSEEQIFNKSC